MQSGPFFLCVFKIVPFICSVLLRCSTATALPRATGSVVLLCGLRREGERLPVQRAVRKYFLSSGFASAAKDTNFHFEVSSVFAGALWHKHLSGLKRLCGGEDLLD